MSRSNRFYDLIRSEIRASNWSVSASSLRNVHDGTRQSCLGRDVSNMSLTCKQKAGCSFKRGTAMFYDKGSRTMITGMSDS